MPKEIESEFRAKLDEWEAEDNISRIWNKNAGVWTGTDEDKWLGWLEIAENEANDLEKYTEFAKDALEFKDIVLLGMGGSSLGPEVFSITFGKKNFHVLDSTVPAQIKTLDSQIDPAQTLFIVASKSGSTLEPNTFKQYFYERVVETVGEENAGRHFAAITDPGSKLEKLAREENFRHIFFGEPTVGGRFSALTVFGLIPAAAMQLDVGAFLENALEMIRACRSRIPADNPGAILGIFMGVAHRAGHDKLTIFCSPEIADLGAWLEQLIAESTGKSGVSIIPIDGEPIAKPDEYSEDRIIVYIRLTATADDTLDEKVDLLEDSGFPVVRIELEDKMRLGQEFFRWEFATAVAGAVMKINPFNQPDVESAKIEARKLTDQYEDTGELPGEEAFFESDGIRLFSSNQYAAQLEKFTGPEKTVGKYLEAHLAHIQENDYFALLAYLEMNEDNRMVLQQIREEIFRQKLAATALGFGPRFLHSTGQAYKGGADNGVFLQITSDDEADFTVPGQNYTFGIVNAAQARGDFQVLLDRNRRALRIHLRKTQDLREVLRLIKKS